MVDIPGIADDADMMDVFAQYPAYLPPLMQVFDHILRNKKSQLSSGQLELMAAYVSGLNNCLYCQEIHNYVANAFGVDLGVTQALLDDLDTAPISANLKPLFAYLRKLTHDPSSLEQGDVDSILQAGWDDKTIFDIVSVCALSNFINRFVEGMGITRTPGRTTLLPKEIMREDYTTLIDLVLD
ncbi:MAG: peroxidase [Kordiimonas sp.]|nr:peroxidase [Kordiimonas sp.]|tara:strand:+ start:2101 stop:2649 length:549 start_codon:yes stop_codon:yes gene_type:complete